MPRARAAGALLASLLLAATAWACTSEGGDEAGEETETSSSGGADCAMSFCGCWEPATLEQKKAESRRRVQEKGLSVRLAKPNGEGS